VQFTGPLFLFLRQKQQFKP